MSKPEVDDISYHISGREPFPSFTFCHPLPERIYQECGILSADYINDLQWNTHDGSKNCTDPYAFKEQAVGNFMDLDILELAIISYDSHFFFEVFELGKLGNETLFEWSSILETKFYIGCHTLTFKKSITDHGIEEVSMYTQVYIHTNVF